MRDEQLTLRLPRELLRDVDRRARALGVPKAQVVREALAAYLAAPAEADQGASLRAASALVGSLSLDPQAVEQDEIAARLRRHNWRA
ncbi:MAG TPA: ribbon-helix-helix protein, CopG family [Gemmatimonadaceae bacterium]|jgi:Arc/MetJ-type ribon-helix-helix transcriptional regulator